MTLDFEKESYHDDYGSMWFECDHCGSTGEFEGSWQECMNEAKEAGWIVRPPDNGAYLHFCCKECNRISGI